MKSLKLLLVEDDIEFSNFILEIIKDKEELLVIGSVDSYIKAIQLLKLQKPDLIIADIHLKGEKTGIDLAKFCSSLKIPILLMTTDDDESLYKDSLALGVHSYLIKPFHKLTLDSAIRNLLQDNYNEDEHQKIVLKSGTVTTIVEIDDVYWIESERNYASVVIKDKKIVVRSSFADLIEKFDNDKIIRIHKSFAVPKQRIKVLNFTKSTVDIGIKELPMGRSYKIDLKKRFGLKNYNTIEI